MSVLPGHVKMAVFALMVSINTHVIVLLDLQDPTVNKVSFANLLLLLAEMFRIYCCLANWLQWHVQVWISCIGDSKLNILSKARNFSVAQFSSFLMPHWLNDMINQKACICQIQLKYRSLLLISSTYFAGVWNLFSSAYFLVFKILWCQNLSFSFYFQSIFDFLPRI